VILLVVAAVKIAVLAVRIACWPAGMIAEMVFVEKYVDGELWEDILVLAALALAGVAHVVQIACVELVLVVGAGGMPLRVPFEPESWSSRGM